MKPIILFRSEIDMEGEMETARRFLPVVDSRVLVPGDSLVIARYSVLPWYEELERDLKHRGSRLLNSYAQHKWIADFMGWGGPVGVLKGMTPQTWPNWSRLPEDMSFVVKGRTNSRKQNWNTHMFCPTRGDVPVVAARLLDDSLIQDQGVVVREYIPLKKLDTGLNGLPITNEWRTFWLSQKGGVQILAAGYYWKASHPDSEERADFAPEALRVARRAAEIVGEYATFFVLDVAETEKGDWIVIEVNDGQMSGLCGCSAEHLYQSLRDAL